MMLTSHSQVLEMAKSKTLKKIVVAAAEDEPVLEAVKIAMQEKIIIPILVGNRKAIEEIATSVNLDVSDVEIIDEKDPVQSSKIAVSLIREGKGEILMKGLVSTAEIMRRVLDKENGLRKGATLSHIAFFEIPTYHKILAVTDAALNVAPTFEEKVDILKNGVLAFSKLGVEIPKVAVLAAVETVNPKMEATVHAAMLTMQCKRKQIKECIVDGPLALDNAVDKEACRHKKIESEVGGDSDLLLCPDIESANVLYKSLSFLGRGISGAIIMGARVPMVLTSRADSERSKLISIAYAAAMG